MQKLCNLGVSSTSTPMILQGTTCFTWNHSKLTAHISELHMCCHLLLEKRCLCLVLYFYLKQDDLMATPMFSINAFKIFELYVSCQHQEETGGWRRQDLYAHLLGHSKALETHRQELQHASIVPFWYVMTFLHLWSWYSTLGSIWPTATICYSPFTLCPAEMHSLIILSFIFHSVNLQDPLKAAAHACFLHASNPFNWSATHLAQHHHHRQKEHSHQFPQISTKCVPCGAQTSCDNWCSVLSTEAACK